jgi:hypothetical protein
MYSNIKDNIDQDIRWDDLPGKGCMMLAYITSEERVLDYTSSGSWRYC